MLSNIGRGFIDDFFKKSDLDELFDTVVLSSEVGRVKPDAKIYQLTADRLEVPVQECLMIDDSETNVAGAQRAGMQGLQYQTFEQCRTDMEKLLGMSHA
jgi:HAD superfamily hydrolase (TIGR01509 family)